MRERIDHASPVPLYLQVAEAVRYRIATGELRSGRRLPSLRQAAGVFGVNLHTVRRAYKELAERGIVEVQPRSGTVVLDGGAACALEASELSSFLRDVLRQGRERWGLTPSQLTSALAEAAAPASKANGVVHVTECSERQARDLAGQLQARWRVRAEPWSLAWEGEPGPGVILATYFHYSDVRRRWPARFATVRFAPIRPDPGVLGRLDALVGEGGPHEVVLCERTEAMARNIAVDLRSILPPSRYTLRIEIGPPADVLKRERVPVLLAPRVCGELAESTLGGRAIEVRYVFDSRALDRLGADMSWEPQ